MPNRDANKRPVVLEVNRVTRGRYFVAVVTKGALEIDIGRRECGRTFPLAALVRLNLQVINLELEEVPINVNGTRPIKLQRIKLGDDRVRISQQGGVHHDQREVDVLEGNTGAIWVDDFIRVHQTIAVGIYEVRAYACKNVNIREAQCQWLDLQTVNSAVICTQAIDFFKPSLEGSICANRV